MQLPCHLDEQPGTFFHLTISETFQFAAEKVYWGKKRCGGDPQLDHSMIQYGFKSAVLVLGYAWDPTISHHNATLQQLSHQQEFSSQYVTAARSQVDQLAQE